MDNLANKPLTRNDLTFWGGIIIGALVLLSSVIWFASNLKSDAQAAVSRAMGVEASIDAKMSALAISVDAKLTNNVIRFDAEDRSIREYIQQRREANERRMTIMEGELSSTTKVAADVTRKLDVVLAILERIEKKQP